MENDIIKDAYYLVGLYKKDSKVVTQLHIQKLMFLFEAYYMNVTNKPYLYQCEFKAWNFGPVATKLYNRFKVYGKNDIVLTRANRRRKQYTRGNQGIITEVI